MVFQRSSIRSSREGKVSLLKEPSAGSSSTSHRYMYEASVYNEEVSSNSSIRLRPDNKLRPQTAPMNEEIPPNNGVLQFVPAFDEDHQQQVLVHASPDTSWDAILREGAAAFPGRGTTGSKSEAAGFSGGPNRFRRSAETTVVQPERPPIALHPSIPQPGKPKGSKVARLASLFSSSNTSKSLSHKKPSFALNTTAATVPSSPSRSSSSGGYVNWPNTLDKRGDPIAVHSSYEESESGGQNQPPQLEADNLPTAECQDAQVRKEIQEWMESETFQNISGVMPDADTSGVIPDPVGKKADDPSIYFEEHKEDVPQNGNPLYSNNRPRWAENDSQGTPSPSRSIPSKTSSAYLDTDIRTMAFPSFGDRGDPHRKQVAAGVMRRVESQGHQAPTEEALAINNSLSPPHRTFPSDSARGYRGLLNKTQDVPNLMDGVDSESVSSSRTSSAVPSNAGGPTFNNPYNNSSSRTLGRPTMSRVHEEVTPQESADSGDVFDEISRYSIGESEFFEGISQCDSKINPSNNPSVTADSRASLREMHSTASSAKRQNQNADKPPAKCDMKLVLLGGGLTTIQTTNESFSNRLMPDDFDECLTNSDIDEFGGTKLPTFEEMAAAGRGVNDSASIVDLSLSVDPSMMDSKDGGRMNFETFDNEFRRHVKQHPPSTGPNISRGSNESSYRDDESAFFSDFYSKDEVGFKGDLSQYYVQPSSIKALVRKYRKMCRMTLANCASYDEIDIVEDEKKIFALFEMRSRIMEKDMERGLERRGGTSVVDDIVTTPYYRKAMRIRDAVIVSKAWRDGASPKDVINTSHLTQRAESSYFIQRPAWNADPFYEPSWHADFDRPQYYWEEVRWVDDMDFMQYKCPSLGARSLRGAEMFTIGDCQSILLKLTNESCIELRAALNEATARQIEAEDRMKEDGDFADGMMTEAEMAYLTAMEEVKIISSQLVVAEKAFALVRDRIRNLVAKYESLLDKIDNDDLASSVVTANSSAYSAYSSRVSEYDREERAWHRRQVRAELSAELAAREALLAKQGEARAVQEEKQQELHAIQMRLAELQSDPSTAVSDRQRSIVLAKAIASRQQSLSNIRNRQQEGAEKSAVDGVKQRFRDRMAARLRRDISGDGNSYERPDPLTASRDAYYMRDAAVPDKRKKAPDLERQKLLRSAGEEMVSYMDFYERSLQAVDAKR